MFLAQKVITELICFVAGVVRLCKINEESVPVMMGLKVWGKPEDDKAVPGSALLGLKARQSFKYTKWWILYWDHSLACHFQFMVSPLRLPKIGDNFCVSLGGCQTSPELLGLQTKAPGRGVEKYKSSESGWERMQKAYWANGAKRFLYWRKLALRRCKASLEWCKRLLGDLCSLGSRRPFARFAHHFREFPMLSPSLRRSGL